MDRESYLLSIGVLFSCLLVLRIPEWMGCYPPAVGIRLSVCIGNTHLVTGGRAAIGNVRYYSNPSSHLLLPLLHQMPGILKYQSRPSYGRRNFPAGHCPSSSLSLTWTAAGCCLSIDLYSCSLYNGIPGRCAAAFWSSAAPHAPG